MFNVSIFQVYRPIGDHPSTSLLNVHITGIVNIRGNTKYIIYGDYSSLFISAPNVYALTAAGNITLEKLRSGLKY